MNTCVSTIRLLHIKWRTSRLTGTGYGPAFIEKAAGQSGWQNGATTHCLLYIYIYIYIVVYLYVCGYRGPHLVLHDICFSSGH